MKHVHFGVALRHLLQQLEQQPENRLQVLKKTGRAQQVLDKRRKEQDNFSRPSHYRKTIKNRIHWGKWLKWVLSTHWEELVRSKLKVVNG